MDMSLGDFVKQHFKSSLSILLKSLASVFHTHTDMVMPILFYTMMGLFM